MSTLCMVESNKIIFKNLSYFCLNCVVEYYYYYHQGNTLNLNSLDNTIPAGFGWQRIITMVAIFQTILFMTGHPWFLRPIIFLRQLLQ